MPQAMPSATKRISPRRVTSQFCFEPPTSRDRSPAELARLPANCGSSVSTLGVGILPQNRSIRRFAHKPIRRFAHKSICRFVYKSIRRCVYKSICRRVYKSIRRCVYKSIRRCVYKSICRCVYRSIRRRMNESPRSKRRNPPGTRRSNGREGGLSPARAAPACRSRGSRSPTRCRTRRRPSRACRPRA